LAPDAGTVARGARVQIAYFDQQREQLDPERSVVDTVNDGNDTVTINGQSRHVVGYLADFLFPRERAVSPVKSLSGGERNRLLLARVFARPSNVLVMDEPTNDLDIETLELLEELIASYPGTVLLVSHDRAFLDNVVTSTLAFEGGGTVTEYVGGWDDYLRQRRALSRQLASAADSKAAGLSRTALRPPSRPPVRGEKRPRAEQAPTSASTDNNPSSARKLSFKEKREIQSLPGKIEALEAEQQRLQQESQSPDFFREPADHIRSVLQRIQEVGSELDAALARWVELEERST
jgi:ATP-binding cassette subfamily F protein uup